MGLGAAGTAAAIAGGTSAIGAGTSLLASSKNAGAAKSAAAGVNARYYDAAGRLQPFTNAGINVLDPMTALASSRTGGGPDYVSQAAGMVPGQMTQAELEATPGYQFTRDEGLQAVQGSAAARGLGVSGAPLKGAVSYATGLANQTYKDQFAIAQQRYSDVLGLNTAQQGNITNQANRYNQIATLGESAAAQTGTIGANMASTSANLINAAGQDQAAGITGVGSAITGGAQNYLNYSNYQKYLGAVQPGQWVVPPSA